MGKLFFIRKSQEEILREQNQLLVQILESKVQQQPQVIVQTVAPTQHPTSSTPEQTEVSAEPEPSFVFEDDVPFIPKITKAKSDMASGVETSATKFDTAGVEKLRKAKLEAQKK